MSPVPSDFVLRFVVFQPEACLHDFLHCRLAANHQQQLELFFVQGRVQLDGQKAIASREIEAGQVVDLCLPDHYEEPVDPGWSTLWENDELMLVNKPALLPVSRTTRNLYHTLISLIRRDTIYSKAQLLHRLDTETSGLILIAKTPDADRKWKPKLSKLIQRKLYRAHVLGSPEWEQKTLECYLGGMAESDIRSQMHVFKDALNGIKPRWSHSHFRVIQRGGNHSLLECELFSGRKHQIRAHLAYLGHPILGDKIYAHQGKYYLKRIAQGLDVEDYEVLRSRFHLLHSYRMVLDLEGETVDIISDPKGWAGDEYIG